MKEKRIVKYLSLFVFALITLFLLFKIPPFWDVAHSWLIAKEFGLSDLFFHIEKRDGHLFIWHLLQMPFAKNNFFYPYPAYFLNWLFCMGALIIFWNKAPFSNLTKMLFTFSYPVLWYFAPVARCYSIGLLFLFLILSLWNKRLKHPVLISILLILFSNTSAMALIGSLPLTLIFSYDLIKSKSKNITPFIILLFGFFLVYIQLFGAYLPSTPAAFGYASFLDKIYEYFFLFESLYFKEPFYIFEKITALTAFVLFWVSLFYTANSKRSFFFFVSTFFLMACLFIFKYTGSFWHYFFFFIYAIGSFWILEIENLNLKTKKIFYVFLNLLLFLFCIKSFIYPFEFNKTVYSSESYEIQKIIKENRLLNKEDKIYAIDFFSQTGTGILPYFDGFIFYNAFGDVKYSVKGFENYYKSLYEKEDVDVFALSLDKSKRNIVITDDKNFSKRYDGIKYNIILKPFYIGDNPHFEIYEAFSVKKD